MRYRLNINKYTQVPTSILGMEKEGEEEYRRGRGGGEQKERIRRGVQKRKRRRRTERKRRV